MALASSAPVRFRRKDLDVLQSEARQERLEVVDDEILELKAHHGVPSRETGERDEFKQPLLDPVPCRQHVLEVEPRIVVLQPVARGEREFARLGIPSLVACQKAGKLQFLKVRPANGHTFAEKAKVCPDQNQTIGHTIA